MDYSAQYELSDSVRVLDDDHLKRYKDKLTLIGSPGPFLISKSMFVNLLSEIGSDALIALPNIKWPDILNYIFNYLMNSSSAYTFKALESYKS